MSSILNLAPQNVWKHFHELTQVPRPSGHLEKIQKFLVDYGKKIGVESFKDEAGNVIYKKPAYPGMENRKTVILQAHMDMVPQKNKDKVHDFEKDPIETVVDGEWVHANGTTLGADDGMGVAAIMAVMEDKNLKHGPLEALITADEETGMYGAFALKPGTVEGDILLNLDSETEGELYIGCAGGVDITASLEYKEVPVDKKKAALKVTLKGPRGGHSGMEINQGRANANKLMARFLNQAAAESEICLVSWEGGNMRNSIPREAESVITLDEEQIANVKKIAETCAMIFSEEFKETEAKITLDVETIETPTVGVPQEISDNIIDAILACPNGVLRYIPTIPDTVETSSNMAIVDVKSGKVSVKFLTRSSRDSMKDYMAQSIAATFRMAGMKVEFSGAYSGWEPNMNSPILKAMTEAYKKQFGEEAQVKVVHAGLECGIIGAVVPELDMISFGPTLESPHTPNERCLISTVERFYEFLVATLENTPLK
jgi:dipeptidase D